MPGVGASLTVLYFAEAARRVGKTEESVTMPRDARLGELQEVLFGRYRDLASLRRQLLWSVDEEMADARTPLLEGCVVGVLPPFSGG